MKQIALSYFEYPELILIPFIIFFLFFLLLLIEISRPQNIEQFKKIEQLPLEEENYDNE